MLREQVGKMTTNLKASPGKPLHTSVEHCDRCDRETDHHVSIELRTESRKPENAKYSNEPYRVTECIRCGTRRSLRMNNA